MSRHLTACDVQLLKHSDVENSVREEIQHQLDWCLHTRSNTYDAQVVLVAAGKGWVGIRFLNIVYIAFAAFPTVAC